MRPLIGITSSLETSENAGLSSSRSTLKVQYAEAIAAVGGVTVILPLATAATASDTMSRLDGMILSGGPDIPAEAFGAAPHLACHYMCSERWASDCTWLRAAIELHVPVLGICLGMQEINVASGGSLIQDLPTERPGSQQHAGSGIGCQHEVLIEPDSWLASVAPSLTMTVTSAHHQAIARLAEGFCISAKAQDGVIETIEKSAPEFVVGVQWHPERCLDQPNWLLAGFVKKVEEVRGCNHVLSQVGSRAEAGTWPREL